MNAFHPSTAGAQALPLDVMLAAIPSLPRAILNQLVDRAIEQMDADDGDPDLEDDDPAGSHEDAGEPGTWPEGDGYGMNHSYGDDEQEDDARHIWASHLHRIQRTRCDREVNRFGDVRYFLRDNGG